MYLPLQVQRLCVREKRIPWSRPARPLGPEWRLSRRLPVHSFPKCPHSWQEWGRRSSQSALPGPVPRSCRRSASTRLPCPARVRSFRSLRLQLLPTWPNDTPFLRKDCRYSILAFGSRLALPCRGSCKDQDCSSVPFQFGLTIISPPP